MYLSQLDDTASSAISIPLDFPFSTSTQTTVYVGSYPFPLLVNDHSATCIYLQVGSNGIISFGTLAYNGHSNSAFPGSSGRYLLAPYWDDINISSGGTISYETFESGFFLKEVNEYIRRKLPTGFEGTWMLVAYYNAVAPYSAGSEEVSLLFVSV